MNIIDPLQGDYPEIIEEYLEHKVMKCISFNRKGTLLAAGCSDGSCVIWDFETRGIAKELQDKDSIAVITSVSWSKYGHRILVSATDKSLSLWDVIKGEKIARMSLQYTPLQACLHPGSSIPSLCLASPLSSAPLIVDFDKGTTTVLPVSLPDIKANGSLGLESQNDRSSHGSGNYTPAVACFNKYGDLVYLGNSRGEILIINHKNAQILSVVQIPGGAVVINIVFDRSGQYLLTNSNDRTIRIYSNLLPFKDELKSFDHPINDLTGKDGVLKLKAAGIQCLALFREFRNYITRMQWKAPCFSGDGEWVVGGSASKREHKIYVWDRAGHLVKILEGPKEALTDLVWHPVHPVLLSVSTTGLVYIWAKNYAENWSAFAPDFKELEENEEYVEREDEFDLMPETGKAKELEINEDDEVDIMNVEKDTTFSDSDMPEGEICFLPVYPTLDVGLQEKDLENFSNLVGSDPSGSPLSENADQNGYYMNHKSSQSNAMDTSAAEDTSILKKKSKAFREGVVVPKQV